jgi:hypothetical protein
MLRDNEWPALLRTAVRAADGRVSITFGIHYKLEHDIATAPRRIHPPFQTASGL